MIAHGSLRVLIVEDEPLLCQQLRETLRELWPEIDQMDEARSGLEAVQKISAAMPDVAFLDINLPDMRGVDLAGLLRGRCHTVFVTAYDQYAVEAFEKEAVDYVLKPATPRRLADTVSRLKARLSESRPPQAGHPAEAASHPGPAGEAHLRWIQAASAGTMQIIPVDDVLYFDADDKYTQVVCRDGEYSVRKPIRELVAELDPECFWQIHRSTVVNVAAIARVVRDANGQMRVHVRDSERSLPVSRAFAHRFRQM